jgi:hypothetical protein
MYIERRTKLPIGILERLLAYVATRLTGPALPSGSCYEFVSFMMGNSESRLAAMRRMNAFLETAQKVPEDQSVPPGDVILVGHPNHLSHEEGLNVLHACISIGEQQHDNWAAYGEVVALHRLAIDGRLAVDSLSDILRSYRKHLYDLKPDYWEADPPTTDDIHLYRVTSSVGGQEFSS